MSYDTPEKAALETVEVAPVYQAPAKPLTRNQREELNALSQDVFGSSSRWQKLITKGQVEQVTEDLDEVLPGQKEGDADIIKKVKISVRREDGSALSVTKHHTVESVREYMLERKEQLTTLRAEIARLQAEAEAKKAQEKLVSEVQSSAGGSAV